jgi:hypothetical protein
MDNHQVIRKALDEAGSTFVSVTFIKKDGTERQATLNPRHYGEVKGTGHVTSDPNIFRFMDAKLNAWRSFDARRVVSVKVKGQVTKLTQEV